ncbi:helix-turn-helix transcriptional regulator [Myroides marinus]|uniref:helix-turn-helix domain-containing protein n=1 Tax=Myroides marinus TaxID=703342 RepID=UPI0025759A95|nr:helix-turn-helix domain-containing protein [Myroides marinus]MDM1346805.1 helix-turn-helix transcriptional regulator [Myroides marinus]MDM1350482.1 helix-turn-helix transcriptional regulator [Myroides marinus]MDM1357689.1 helix-turn-helix transcriptional regulator [Myroides marinus]MDM1361476.1 helix-turn-helix transcriptional regulator [Myroides marinus]MDM1365124.1 helix-turn-helix transcriptional regulator [Myroides marinus]
MRNLSNPYNEKNDRAIFEKVVLLAIILVISQLVLSLFDINITFGYFILPIMYVMIKFDRTQVDIFEKIIPHFLFTTTVVLFGLSSYQVFYEVINLIFLVGYTSAIYLNRHGKMFKQLNFETFNFIGFYSFYIVAGTAVCLFYFVMSLLEIKCNVQSNFVFASLDFFAVLFSMVTLSVSRSKSRDMVMEPVVEYKAIKEEKTEKELVVSNATAKNIVQYFEESENYLETSFSLDQLADDLNLNKQVVSEVINQDMNSSFYQLVAMYRINHAKRLIGKNTNLTIEAIVDECGFSSKSTFNKYFKIFVGQTPSVYRNAVA